MVKAFALGKINLAIKNYTDDTLSTLDRRLLKGFYVADALELENDSEIESAKFTTRVDKGKIAKVLMASEQEKARHILAKANKYMKEEEKIDETVTPLTDALGGGVS